MPARTLALALALTVAACGVGAEPDSIAPNTTTPPSSTETSPSPSSTETTNTTMPAGDLESWLGAYTWVEFFEGDPGSDQTLVHELVLDQVEATGLLGAFNQDGFQTFVVLTVEARAVGQSLEIAVRSVDEGVSSYAPGDVLFTLEGDPDDPVTSVERLATLTRPDGPGRYFGPGAASVNQEEEGGAVWVVDATTFDLALVDLVTGDVLRTITGWGADFVDPVEGPIQALQTLEVDSRGRVWVDDCCEPAFGNTFGIDAETDTSIQEAQIRLFGLTPRVTPSGDFVAVAVGDLGVGVHDTATGGTVVAPGTIYSLVTDADFAFLTPIAWSDDTTLAVAVPGESTFTVAFVDLADPGEPGLHGVSDAIDGIVLDGDFRADGTVAALVAPEPSTSARRMVIVSPPTGAVIEILDLPDGTAGIDYDTTGNNLLLLTADGGLRMLESEDVLTGPFVDAAR